MNSNKFLSTFKKVASSALAISLVAGANIGSFARVDEDSPLPDSVAKSVVTTNASQTSKKVTIKTLDAANSLVAKGAIRGIDVSKWQGKIDWSKVSQDNHNIKFAFIRSNYGAEADPYFVSNVEGAQASGIKAGAYHYARFKSKEDVKTEAQAFLNQINRVDLDYPVVLDVENHYNLSKKELTELCNYFMELLESKGHTVVLYTFNNFYKAKLDSTSLNDNHVWIANYVEHPADIQHTLWQHTSYGTVSGIAGRVDINVAYQDLSTKSASGSARAGSSATPTVVPVATSEPTGTPTPGSDGTSKDKDSVVASGVKVVGGSDSAKTIQPAEKKEVKPLVVAPVPASGDVKISPTIHKAIAESMNKNFESDLKADAIDMATIDKLLMTGIQREIKTHFNAAIAETGILTDADIDEITKLTGAQISETNIMKYIQKKLVYLGYYNEQPSGRFDAKTNEALKAFQEKNGITANGVLNKTTIKRLYGVA